MVYLKVFISSYKVESLSTEIYPKQTQTPVLLAQTNGDKQINKKIEKKYAKLGM